MCNHIVDVRDGSLRRALAKSFVDLILQSFQRGEPFTITPALNDASLKMLLKCFADEFASERVGLTDTSIIEEAQRLKRKYGHARNVHIWTKDQRLKAREPDAEPNPFVL